MDIVAHGLWAGVGVALARRHRPIPDRVAVSAVVMAVVPDLAQLLPLLVTALFAEGGWSVLRAYATALPGLEPAMPPLVAALTHHLHCTLHSAVVAGAVTLLVWRITRAAWVWYPLLGWWSHILIDVFTHSTQFYPVPVFYPFTPWGFDGLAWNTPWFLAANYLAISLAWAGVLLTRTSTGQGPPPG